MDGRSATIFVTKLGAAERQLNAAIRMSLANEDELAIHTVAAAAYRVLRDIKEKRGRSDSHDLFLRGLFGIAHDLATGKKNSMPPAIADAGPALLGAIESMRAGIAAGTIKTWQDLAPIKVDNEGQFWREFNRPFNFLKHASEDSNEALDLSKIKNHELLVRAAGVFMEITNRTTPEIEVYYFFTASHGENSGLSDEFRTEFANLTESKKRKKCLAWLRTWRTTRAPLPTGAL